MGLIIKLLMAFALTVLATLPISAFLAADAVAQVRAGEDSSMPTTTTGALLVGFMTLMGLMVWQLKHVNTVTIPNLSTTFAAAHKATLDDSELKQARLQAMADKRHDALLEHCEKENSLERGASERRFDKALEEMRRIHGETSGRVDRVIVQVGEQANMMRTLLATVTQRTRLADVVTSAEDAIWTKTLDGFITSWNRAAEMLLGWRAEEVVSQSVYKLVPTDRHEQERETLSLMARGERVERYDGERLHKDGRRVRLWITISPLKEPSGRVIGVSSIAREV